MIAFVCGMVGATHKRAHECDLSERWKQDSALVILPGNKAASLPASLCMRVTANRDGRIGHGPTPGSCSEHTILFLTTALGWY